MTPEEKTVNKVGPGGYKCPCCGPAPRLRKKWRRRIRHRLEERARKHIAKEIIDDPKLL